MSSTSLPESWVDRLFGRFTAMFGAQKVAAMWAGASLGEVKAVWGAGLGQFSGETIAAAMSDLLHSGREWPPSLPEFVAMCGEAARNRAPQQPFVALPPAAADRELGEKVLGKLSQGQTKGAASFGPSDPMFWARHPKSAKAVELLLRGAPRSYPLMRILRAHLADGGVNCRSDEAQKAIQHLAANLPAWVNEVAA